MQGGVCLRDSFLCLGVRSSDIIIFLNQEKAEDDFTVSHPKKQRPSSSSGRCEDKYQTIGKADNYTENNICIPRATFRLCCFLSGTVFFFLVTADTDKCYLNID
jgi:hypothetical protein